VFFPDNYFNAWKVELRQRKVKKELVNNPLGEWDLRDDHCAD
jgi:hypothetical protein